MGVQVEYHLKETGNTVSLVRSASVRVIYAGGFHQLKRWIKLATGGICERISMESRYFGEHRGNSVEGSRTYNKDSKEILGTSREMKLG
jgi:hypothetical protein